MPIMNYSTEVAPERTVAEITALLVRKGALSITTEFDGKGNQVGVTFVMPVGGLDVRFQLPANIEGVARVMLRDKPWKGTGTNRVNKTIYEGRMVARARWVAWRILKDWIEAQMALIESGQAEPGQVFMPYALNSGNRTMYQLFVENNQKQLGAGVE